MLKVLHVYTIYRFLLVSSKSPHPLGLGGSEYFPEHFLSIVDHIDGFLGKSMFLHHIGQCGTQVFYVALNRPLNN
jgi:hypothetical protein